MFFAHQRLKKKRDMHHKLRIINFSRFIIEIKTSGGIRIMQITLTVWTIKRQKKYFMTSNKQTLWL